MTYSVFQTAANEDDRLRVELVCPPALFYALVHNRVAVVRHLSVTNISDRPIHDLDVTLELVGPDGPLAEPWHRHVRIVETEHSVSWDEFHDFTPSVSALKNTNESFPVTYRVTACAEDGTEVLLSEPSRVLAHNEWLNAPALYESIAAFVQPNTDSINWVLRAAAELLARQTGSGSLQGYQAGPKRAAEIGAAVYEALREEKVTYVGTPASFEDTGQKIRTTAAVLRDRLGNCIDLSVTYAACLEAAGLHPIIWIVDGHAFAGFFLGEDRLPDTVCLEPAQMINVVESTKALAVELTGVGPGTDSLNFADATRIGRTNLRQRRLVGMIDVRLAHRSGIQPLPSSDTAAASPDADVATAPSSTHRGFALPTELEDSGAFEHEANLEIHAADDGAPPRVAAWRRALLDLSLRNPLLKLPKRGKGVELHVPADSLAVLDDLVHGGKNINIVAQDTVGGVHELQGVRHAQDLPDAVVAEELVKDHRIYAVVNQASYVARVRSLQRDARTLEQETGSNYLYLTFGSLVHPTPSGEAHAPLFLLPVRIEGGAGRRPYTVSIDGNELAAPNYCLVQWLRVKHGVRIAELEEPILDEHGIDITASFRAIRKALVGNNLNYRIDESASLRLLKFSTFQMWRDLTDHWETFQQNPVVRHLVENAGKPMVDTGARSTEVMVNEGALHLPIAADGSQMRAVVLAEQGRSFVLEGPPGTGKSQTITNLIAHAVRSGRTVLFVAEKQAALDVVKRRLTAIGLEDFCLDLHGRRQTLRSIHQQLKAALEQQIRGDQHGWKATAAAYRARVAALARHPEQVHAENAAGYSAWSAYSATLDNGEGPTAAIPATYFTLPQSTRSAADDASQELPPIALSAGLRPQHPLLISGRRDVTGVSTDLLADTARQLEDLRRRFGQVPSALRVRISELAHPTALAAGRDAAGLASAGQLPDERRTHIARQPGWDNTVISAYDAVVGLQQQHRSVLSKFRQDLFAMPNFDELETRAAAAESGLLGKKKRRIELADALRPHLSSTDLLDESTVVPAFQAIVAARDAAATVTAQVRAVPGLNLPDSWWPTEPGAGDAIQSTYRTLIVSRELYDQLPGLWQCFNELGTRLPADLVIAFVDVWTRWLHLLSTTNIEFKHWSAGLGWAATWERDGAQWVGLTSGSLLPLQRWGALLCHTDILAQAGLTEFRRQVLDGEIPANDIEGAFLRGVARAALDERLAASGLDYFDAGAHEHEVEDYLRLAAELRDQLPERLTSDIVARRPSLDRALHAKAGELVRRLNSRRDRLSFRDAYAAEPGVIRALTPCFLMSPGSVANFLEPEANPFDLVVFDEASQIRVAQAIGTMGRARSVVIVGDSKQMPPTTIMEATYAEDTDDTSVPEDLDSILAECVESGLPRESLTWHYRSTDESLISFSNTHYYDNKLASLPAPGGDPTTGIQWRRVDGHYERGGSRTNLVEAQAVVAEIRRLLINPATAGRSIGVVTFNIQQRDLLLNLVEESSDEHVQAALARQDDEALFVKNLENVQGDERDVILFSLAYSKNPDTGELPLNFGPLTTQGGERRLNVAITRARTQVIVFSSFDAKDINLSRTTAVGTQHLRAYLEVAAGGVDRSGEVTSRRDGRAERIAGEIAAELRVRGHEVELDFGLSHFTVDLAVRVPGSDRWQVAVMLDGPAWGARPTVADRDAAPRLLETLMRWSMVVHVWLAQWISDRESVLRSIDDAIAGAAANELVATPEDIDHISLDEPEMEEAIPAWPRADDCALVESIGNVGPTLALGQAVTAIPTAVVETDHELAAFVPYLPTPIGTKQQLDNLADNRAVQDLVRQSMAEVINAEGPIEQVRLSRLVHKRFDLHKVNETRRKLLLRYLPGNYPVTQHGRARFVWPERLNPDAWRGFRRTLDTKDRDFHEIAPEEIANAMRYAFDTDATQDTEQLQRATMRALGYRRKSPAIDDYLVRVLDWASADGRLPARRDGRQHQE